MQVLRISHSAVVAAWRARERALAAEGFDVQLLTARAWDEAGSRVELRAEPGERVQAVRTWGGHPALFVYDPRPLWRQLGRRWDLLDIHEEPYSLAAAEIRALRTLRGQRAPYCLYSAQNIPKRYPPPFRWLERAALRGARGLYCCNDESGRICRVKGYPGRPRTIPLGIDPAVFTAAGHREPTPERLVVGYAGRLEHRKGVGVLLDAFARLPAQLPPGCTAELRIAGDGPDREELVAEAHDLGLGDRAEFLGPLGAAALAGFYRELDVLAVPSLGTPGWVEQFGRVAVEAMACGTPVVASRSEALPEVVRGAGTLVPSGDVDALVRALLELRDPVAWHRAQASGLDRAARCTWPRVADRMGGLYRAMLSPRERTAARGLDIILVAYRHPELVRRALEPLAGMPVTVVDNSSMDQLRRLCEDLGVRYLDAGRNGGFARGVNLGLAARDDPHTDVLLLNPDARITSRQIGQLHRALHSRPSIASVGPRQVDERGRRTRVRWPFPNPAASWLEAFGLGRLGLWRADHSDRGFVIGSVLLLNAAALDMVGAFDEGFFLYSEETDWATRASRMGWSHRVVPEVEVEHLGAATSEREDDRQVHFHASQERYLRKHYGAFGWQCARAAQLAGSLARSAVPSPGIAGPARLRVRLYARGPVACESVLGEP